MIAVEEYLDFTPWEGFRFGMIQPERKGSISRISIQGRSYDVETSKKELVLREEGKEIVAIDGPAVVRHFLYSDNEVAFEIRAIAERRVKIQFLKRGKFQLLVDNQPKKIFSGRSVKFDVPEGPHAVEVQLLEELD